MQEEPMIRSSPFYDSVTASLLIITVIAKSKIRGLLKKFIDNQVGIMARLGSLHGRTELHRPGQSTVARLKRRSCVTDVRWLSDDVYTEESTD